MEGLYLAYYYNEMRAKNHEFCETYATRWGYYIYIYHNLQEKFKSLS